MKKLLYLSLLLIASSVFVSCNDEETYADQKKREAERIKNWIAQKDIDVISLSDFLKDTITNNPETGPDKTRNEYVLFDDNGIYMQIVRRGDGRLMEAGEIWYMNARYVEQYIDDGDTLSMNLYQQVPDIFYVKRTGGNYTASFISGIMSIKYSSNSVPNAWIMLFSYIKPDLLNGESAKVRLIVPHNQGTQYAASNVYPAFYEIIISKQKYN
ncbi:MAG: DUF4827 domain-containing protein [Bacteroidaceae bacterium]